MVFSGVLSLKSPMGPGCSQAKTWVETHYEKNEDGVVAKAIMYKHYEDYCREQSRNTMETSIFGRVVKSVFKDVKIRRLGGRDNLKYYYCGIQAKESSPYVIDNSTTTRPKRRLRKREILGENEDVLKCLRWLHANFEACSDSPLVKADLYEKYLQDLAHYSTETLSQQYFGLVVSHAFPNVTKRKMGPRTNQQKYYFGIKEKAPAGDLAMPDAEEDSDSLKDYRECEKAAVEDDEYSCRSPASEDSDMDVPSDAYEQYEKTNQPIDYSFSTLRLKDEPVSEAIIVKEEPLDLQMTRENDSRCSPDRPSSAVTYSSSSSASPPIKEVKPNKIYKPRFHFNYDDDNDWHEEADLDAPLKAKVSVGASSPEQPDNVSPLLGWISENLEEAPGVSCNRDKLYKYYENNCDLEQTVALSLKCFDALVHDIFSNLVTVVECPGVVLYEGISPKRSSLYYGKVEVLRHSDSWSDSSLVVGSPQSPPPPPHPVVTQAKEVCYKQEERQGAADSSYHDDSQMSLDTTPEVLRDGKYYLKKWLMDNFEPVLDSCILKSDAYKFYEQYTKSINQTTFEMNVFGKIVRIVFPEVTIRRLGGRERPQYHYCGIAAKKSSELYQHMGGKDPAQRSRKKEIATDNRSAEIVIEWLKERYEARKDKLIMKSDVFSRYTEYCKSIYETPVTLNYFGKLVKHSFPNVEVRKFGGRSEPTWYYYGLMPRGEMMVAASGVVDDLPRKNANSPLFDSITQQSSYSSRGISPDHKQIPWNAGAASSPIPISNCSPGIGIGTPDSVPYNSPSFLHVPSRASPHVRSQCGPAIAQSPCDSDCYLGYHSSLSPGISQHVLDSPISGSPSERPSRSYDVARTAAFSPNDEMHFLAMYSSSPIERPIHSFHLSPSTAEAGHRSPVDASYFQEHLRRKQASLGHISSGAQVVPSQTPPNSFPSNHLSIPKSGVSNKRPKMYMWDSVSLSEMHIE